MQFYIVYIKEAHPTDGWQVGKNTREGIEFTQPKDEKARIDVASKCMKGLKLELPVLIDGMDNKVNAAYSGWPDRLFVVGHDGKIAYAGARGPRGFDPESWEEGIKKAIKAAPEPKTDDGAAESKDGDAKKDTEESGDAKKQ